MPKKSQSRKPKSSKLQQPGSRKSTVVTSKTGAKQYNNSNHNISSNTKQEKLPVATTSLAVSLSSQQAILDSFAAAYAYVLASPSRDARIQEIKAALYARDFSIFGKVGDSDKNTAALVAADDDEKEREREERKESLGSGLDIYSARWSPTRALAYAFILVPLFRDGGILVEWGYKAKYNSSVGDGVNVKQQVANPNGTIVQVDSVEKTVLSTMKRLDQGLSDLRLSSSLAITRKEKAAESSKVAGQIMATAATSPSVAATLGAGGDILDIQNAASTTEKPGEEIPLGDNFVHQYCRLHILALGGTPAELAAVVAAASCSTSTMVSLNLVDMAAWGPSIARLERQLLPALRPWTNSSGNDQLRINFKQHDILALSTNELSRLLSPLSLDIGSPPSSSAVAVGDMTVPHLPPHQSHPALITLLFTLNELYNLPRQDGDVSGISKTTAFLLRLSEVVAPGSLLLVVDSPGSYSEALIGKGKGNLSSNTSRQYMQQDGSSKKRYPMHWLLEHTLLKTVIEAERPLAGQEGGVSGRMQRLCRWEKVDSCESRWFRLDPSLTYPMKLEDMRYQIHLYRALAS